MAHLAAIFFLWIKSEPDSTGRRVRLRYAATCAVPPKLSRLPIQTPEQAPPLLEPEAANPSTAVSLESHRRFAERRVALRCFPFVLFGSGEFPTLSSLSWASPFGKPSTVGS